MEITSTRTTVQYTLVLDQEELQHLRQLLGAHSPGGVNTRMFEAVKPYTQPAKF